MLKNKPRPMPEPTYMSKEQTAQYLSDLRQSAVSRPSGSRPPPPSKFNRLRRAETDISEVAVPVPVSEEQQQIHEPSRLEKRSSMSSFLPSSSSRRLSHRKTESSLAEMNQIRKSPFAGRPLARPPPAAEPLPAAAVAAAVPPSSALPTASVTSRSTTPAPAGGRPSSIHRTPSMTYLESGTRWMEKQEAHSLRRALEDMDDLEAERKLYAAAQNEAAELVWQHQHPHLPYANPDLVGGGDAGGRNGAVTPIPASVPTPAPDYRAHLRKGSYQRNFSQSSSGSSVAGGIMGAAGGRRTVSGGSHSSTESDVPAARCVSPPIQQEIKSSKRLSSGKGYDALANAVAADIKQAHRRISSGSKRILSGEKRPFMNPNDRIWEDPQEGGLAGAAPKLPPPVVQEAQVKDPAVRLPAHIRKNPFARVRMQHESTSAAGPGRSHSAPILPPSSMSPTPASASVAPKLDRVEIQRNPPTQSRNPGYVSNAATPPKAPSHIEADTTTPTKDGKEIRGDDIRAATSKSRKDYSPKLPRPTMVSDRPGRPIVSFQARREVVMEEVHAPAAAAPLAPTINLPSAQISQPPPPTIVLPDERPGSVMTSCRSEPPTPAINVEPPSIAINGFDAPSINVSGPDPPSININGATAPSITLNNDAPTPRPLPIHAHRVQKSSLHYTPSLRSSGALCAQCALPIAGRVLSAAGERFHPGCFICHTCGTNLECVAFYPEPEGPRAARLDRIRARQLGLPMPAPPSPSTDPTAPPPAALEDDGADDDATLRFYCHLDFHERFSPRCKTCQTPIESGEVVVACGAAFHPGHFFCAQCGDPFDAATPFVEREGYAWCVGCHTHRASPRCAKCKKPVVEDVVVAALGKQWHAGCFVCTECNGEFVDGRYFLRGEDPPAPACVRCESRRLKA